MKKSLLSAFAVLLLALQSFSQYFEWNKTIGYVSGFSSNSLSLVTCNANYNGEVISTYIDHSCLMCTHRTYIKKTNTVGIPAWGIMYDFFPFYNERLSGDGFNNTYMLCKFTSNLRLDTGYVSVNCTADTLAFIMYRAALSYTAKWFKKDRYKDFYVTYTGYNYLLTADSLEKNDSSGVVQWKRATGGTMILADTSGNYYVRDSVIITSYDDSGTLRWTIPVTTNTKMSADVMVRQLYLVRNDSIFSIDKTTGAVLNVYRNYGGNNLKFDSNGNYYGGGSKYSLSSGFLWSINTPGINTLSLDKDDNVYCGFALSSAAAHNVFVPPSYYSYSDGQWTGSYLAEAIAYKISNNDSINNAVITTGNVKAVCVNGKMEVPFTLNQYYVQYISAGFSVELSDSSGSFANPVVIGTGTRSPIQCTVPFFNAFSSNYRIRVVSNTNPKVIGSSTGNLSAYQPFGMHITPSNYYAYLDIYCSPLYLSASPTQNLTYKWYYKEMSNPTWTQAFGNSMSTIQANHANMFSSFHSYMVEGTDTTTGCISSARLDYIKFTSNIIPNINIPAVVCLNSAPVQLFQATLHGAYSGPGISGLFFYPDSAGYGSHTITYTNFDTLSCIPLTWSKTILVDSCNTPLITGTINNGAKTKFCEGDTLIVPFTYDSTAIPAGTWFYLYPQYSSSPIDSTQASPFTTVISNSLASYYNYPYKMRLLVKTKTPNISGTLNYGQPVEIHKLPVISSFTANASAISCINGTNILLDIKAPGYIYRWHHDNNNAMDDTTRTLSNDPFGSYYVYGTQSTYMANTTGFYWVEVFNGLGCPSVSDSVFIADSSQFTNYSVNLSNSPFCSGDSALVTLTTDSLNTVTWYKQGSVFTPANPYQFYINDTASYSVRIENQYGCERQQTVRAVVMNAAIPLITSTSGHFWLCDDDSIRLEVSNNVFTNINWYKDGVLLPPGNGFYSPYISDSGYYYLSCNHSVCHVMSDSVFVSEHTVSVADILTDSIFSCSSNMPVTLHAVTDTNYLTYNWWLYQYSIPGQNEITSSNQLSMVLAFIPSSGMYHLKVDNPYCTGNAYDSVYIGSYQMPNSNIFSNDPLTFCIGDSALLQNLNTNPQYIQWFNDTTLLSAGTQPFLTVYQQGNYYAVTTDSFCVDTSNIIVVTTPCVTGIDNVSNLSDEIMITPNPANDLVHVVLQGPAQQFSLAELYDSQLKMLDATTCKNGCSFDVSKLARGVYIIKVSNNSKVIVNRFFKF